MTTQDILLAAYNLLGDGQGAEWYENPEYTRGVIELVSELVPISSEVIDMGGDGRDPFILGMIFAAATLRAQEVGA